MLAAITPIVDAADAAGADVVIEAVFEDPAVKARVCLKPFVRCCKHRCGVRPAF